MTYADRRGFISQAASVERTQRDKLSFGKLSRTKVVLIAGNHDYIRKDSRYLQIAWSENVYPLFETTLHRAVIEELDLAVYGFSYDRREIREARYDEAYAPRDMKYEILRGSRGG